MHMISPPPFVEHRSFTSPLPTQQQQLKSWQLQHHGGGSGDGYPNPSPTAIASMTSPHTATQIRKRFPSLETSPSGSSLAGRHDSWVAENQGRDRWAQSASRVSSELDLFPVCASPLYCDLYANDCTAPITRPQPTKANKLSASAQPFQFKSRSNSNSNSWSLVA